MAKRKKDNEDQDDQNTNPQDDSAENFGLPDIEYKPLERTETETRETFVEPVQETERVSEIRHDEEHVEEPVGYYDDEEPRSKAPLFITLAIIVVVVAALFLLYKYVYQPKMAEKARIELAAKEKAAADKKAEDDRLAKEAQENERKRLEAEAVKAKPTVGTIETLSAPTRRYYVVLSSDIDDDLIMDFAKRLSEKGVSTKIIPPFGTTKFYRLAMASDYGTYAEAQSGADGSKGAELGANLWVMRY